jgi:Bacterial regulatory protein, Fis family
MPQGVVVPWNEVERRAIEDALDQCDSNCVLAAQLLGIGKTTICRIARKCNYQPSMSIIVFCPLSITRDRPFPLAMRSVRCVPYGTINRLLPNFCDPKSCRFAGRKAAMEDYRVDELRAELGQLLKKQAEVLESRSLGAATDTELLEYEIRQDIVHEICNQLAHSISGSGSGTRV